MNIKHKYELHMLLHLVILFHLILTKKRGMDLATQQSIS